MQRQKTETGRELGPAAVETLLDTDEAVLLEGIGQFQAASRDGALEAEAEGPAGDLRELGSRVLARFHRQLYDLLCGDGSEADQDRQALRSALALDKVTVVGAMTAALIAVGCPPPAAPLIAAVLVKQGIDPVWQETCSWWGAKLAAPAG